MRGAGRLPAKDVAHRMAEIRPFQVMALLARAKELEAQGQDIVHMEIGEPDFLTPGPVVEAAQQVLAEGDIRYTPATGLPALRQAVADAYAERYGVSIPAQRILLTPGASGALLLALGVLLDPGQGVMLADPGYPCNRNFVRFLDGRVQAVPVTAATGYQLTAELIDSHWRPETRVVLLASPANPTGTLVDADSLQQINALVQARGGTLIVDEIYQGLIYEGSSYTALGLDDQIVVINSFSKYFNMTGWRLGWVVAPLQFVEAMDKLAQNLFLAAPTLSQHAALAAFSPATRKILEARRVEFQRRRDYLLPALRELGFSIPIKPQGAFYLYAGCQLFSNDSEAFALDLLENAGVAITPGTDFGDNAPLQHVRFAYTTSLERLQEGVRRLKAFL